MNKINKVIFVAASGTARAPMAAAIFTNFSLSRNIIGESRGLVVQFPEPINQKVEAVLIGNGIVLSYFASQKREEDDFTNDTLIIAMEEKQRQKILECYDRATEENTVVLSTFVGDELEIMDPYGAPIQTYGLCYEVLKSSIEKLINIIV